MNTAELFVRCLEAEGVTRIFGVPGEENAHFMMALENSPIDFVLCRHEQGAAFMCDAHGRLTGEAAVCLGTLGPGATNLITGVTDLEFDNPDFTQLGESFGWDTHYIADSAKLRPALEAAFQCPDPSLVVIPIDYAENNKLTKRLGEIACPI